MFFNWSFYGSSWTVTLTFSISECCMLHFLRHKGDFSAILSYPWYPVEFFGDHRSKTKFAKDFPNVICITNCKPRYSKSVLKMCFEFWAKCHFQWTQKSVHLHCYGSFKWRLHVFRRQLSNSHHCLVYVLLEDVNQISRTEKCHFAFYAFYIFHEQRFQSFTSRLVKSRVVV